MKSSRQGAGYALAKVRTASAAKFSFSNLDFSRHREFPHPVLGQREIHLWHANPRHNDVGIQEFVALLSPDELDRMARFRFEHDRRNFEFAHGVLRTVLAKYVNSAPASLRFCYSEHRKPDLAAPHAESGLRFNLSHSDGYVLLAVCSNREVGVDVEKLREDFETDELAARFFSSAERRALSRLPKQHRRHAFFRCWTRKEALLKARGGGLILPLDNFDVSIGERDVEVGLVTRPDGEDARRWRIFSTEVPEGFAAAVAVRN